MESLESLFFVPFLVAVSPHADHDNAHAKIEQGNLTVEPGPLAGTVGWAKRRADILWHRLFCRNTRMCSRHVQQLTEESYAVLSSKASDQHHGVIPATHLYLV